MARTPKVPDLPLGEALRVRPVGITTVGLALRIAVATTVSYFFALQVSESEFVLFAPVTTLLVVQASPFATLGASLQRVVGTGVGVLLATLYVQVVDVNAASFLVAILVALLVARRLPVSLATQLQIPVAVVFVLSLGSDGFVQDAWRVIDVIIGGVVGVIAVYAWPGRPDAAPAEQAASDFSVAVVEQLRAIGEEVGTHPRLLPEAQKHTFSRTSRALRVVAAAARDAHAAAVQSLRFNPRARGTAEQLDAVDARITWLGGLAIQTRALSGAADRLYDRPQFEPALSPATARRLLDELADLVDAADRADLRADVKAERLRRDIAVAIDDVATGRVPVSEILQSISLLGRLDLFVDSVMRAPGLGDADADDDDTDETDDPPLGGEEIGGDAGGPGVEDGPRPADR